eukprot:6675975-Pyramimonas_sp.AAC.1
MPEAPLRTPIRIPPGATSRRPRASWTWVGGSGDDGNGDRRSMDDGETEMTATTMTIMTTTMTKMKIDGRRSNFQITARHLDLQGANPMRDASDLSTCHVVMALLGGGPEF